MIEINPSYNHLQLCNSTILFKKKLKLICILAECPFVKEDHYGKEKILHWICKRLFDLHCFMDINCFADQIFVPLADFFDRNDFL